MTANVSPLTFQNLLSPTEALFWPRISRVAGLLMLMLRLCRPISARQASKMLNLHYRTSLEYFRTLQQMGLVWRDETNKVFCLTAGLLDAPGSQETLESCQDTETGSFLTSSASFSRIIYLIVNISELNSEKDSTLTSKQVNTDREKGATNRPSLPRTVPARKPKPVAGPSPGIAEQTGMYSRQKQNAEVEEALRQAGIFNPKRARLARMPGITAKRVRLWEQQLKQEKGNLYNTGLLIYFLESDLPDPPSKTNGHLLTCNCMECQRRMYDVCLVCFENPCRCVS